MAFDASIPLSGTSLRTSNPQILANQAQIQTALDNEHIFTGTAAGTQTGDHTQGSARCYSQASAPTTRIDGNGFLSTDLGSLWHDTGDNAISVLTATTPTWTLLSTEGIATLLGSPRTFLDTLDVTGILAALASMTVATTLDVTGATELIGVATIADESVTKTTAAPTADAQIANKKYVDDQVAAEATLRAFGAYTSQDDDSNSMVKSHAYLANQDGFVTCYDTQINGSEALVGYIGDTDDPAGAGDSVAAWSSGQSTETGTITFPVASGKYFEITWAGAGEPTIYWHPVGTLIKPTDQD